VAAETTPPMAVADAEGLPGSPLHLREGSEHCVSLTDLEAQWLRSTYGRHLDLLRHGKRGAWALRAGRICGIITLPGGRRIYIEPRVPVRNVWTLLWLAGEVDCIAPPAAVAETFAGLADGMMELFVTEVARLIGSGVASGYNHVERVLPCVRGRLDLQRQLRELPHRLDRFACRFSELSRDTLENRVLAAALELVVRAAGGDLSLRARAAWCLRTLSSTVATRPLKAGEIAAARAGLAQRQYRVPLALARLLLEGLGVSHRPAGHLRGPATPTLLVEMPRLFERVVCRSLQQNLPLPLRASSGGHSRALDESGHALLSPDALIEGPDGPICVVDAKYKPDSGTRREPSADDTYQMLAYCIGYGVRHAVLVYPRAVDAPPLRINSGSFNATIHTLGLDLSADARSIKPEAARLAAQVAELLAEGAQVLPR